MSAIYKSTDVLILGGGTAALRAAVAASMAGVSVTMLRKGPPNVWIVAFNAPVLEGVDSPGAYFNDMVRQGGFISDFDLVSTLTSEAINQVHFFEEHGISFQHGDKGYAPRLTSGNRTPRSLYTTDRVGPEMIAVMRRLLREQKASIKSNRSAISLLINNDKAVGVLAVDQKNWNLEVYQAKAIVLATGGLGRLYSVSNNNPDLKGDGYVLAYRAGAELVDMEFVQFEPFWVIVPGMKETNGTSFLLDDGPRIYNGKGEEFIPFKGMGLGKAELSREIFLQVQAGNGTPNGGVYFDLTHVPAEKLKTHARFLAFCKRAGLDLSKAPLEVGPTQHHMMGGVRIDPKAQSTIPGLFAAGEVAGGVHGADRLAGNSGTDVLVYGARAGQFAAEYAKASGELSIPSRIISDSAMVLDRFAGSESLDQNAVNEIHTKLEEVLWDKAGIVRHKASLETTLDVILGLKNETLKLKAKEIGEQVQILELENHLLVAEMIARGALLREESRGAHYRSDFPQRDDRNWLKSIMTYQQESEMKNAILQLKRVRTELVE